ncbi:hypothetical protein LJC71_02690 [Desulfosarcina sp. OttesenSCG-928-A07]|nr:hypothetical protein [Desulfosarcina sp. OttesenSCG-928-G17]MDL2328644.1 hypothetical protein [Desulfosarcina sp. OttesenSCG-928-A07]
MKKIFALCLVFVFSSAPAFAHTALMSCFDEGDGTITCEGGFSDGSSASGVDVRVEQNGKAIHSAKFSETGDINFTKPSGDYVVIFDAGKGHGVVVDGKDITE